MIVPAGKYKLTSGELLVDKELTIKGAGARDTLVSGTHSSRVFKVTAGPVHMSGLTVANGVTPGANTGDNSGGGMNIGGGATVVLTKMAVRNNQAVPATSSVYGGGISTNGPLTLRSSTVSEDSASNETHNVFGGGIDAELGGQLTLLNSTITLNNVQGPVRLGAGIYLESDATIPSSTVVDNSGSAGIYNNGSGTATVNGTILATYDISGNCLGSGPFVSAGHNLQSADDCGFAAQGDLVNTDPLLRPLGDYGGQTDTELPKPDSPAIDAMGHSCPPPKVDQRGVKRPQGKRCDIGSVEREQ